MKLYFTLPQKIIEIACIAVILFIVVFWIAGYSSIPDMVPMHYGFDGVPTAFSEKKTILILPIITLAVYAVITILLFFPNTWNLPVKLTPENRGRVLTATRTMLCLIKLEVCALLAYLFVRSAKVMPLGAAFVPVTLVVVLGTVLFYFVWIKITGR